MSLVVPIVPTAYRTSQASSLIDKDYGYKAMTKQQFLDTVIAPYKQHIAYDEKSNQLLSLQRNFSDEDYEVLFDQKDDNKEHKQWKSYSVVSFEWKPPQLKQSLYNTIDHNTPHTKLDKQVEPRILAVQLAAVYDGDRKEPVKFVYIGFISHGTYYPEQPIEFTDRVTLSFGVYYFDKLSQEELFIDIPNIRMPLNLYYDLPDGVYGYKYRGSDRDTIAIFKGGACQGEYATYNAIVSADVIINGETVESLGSIYHKYIDRRERQCIIDDDSRSYFTYMFQYDEQHRMHGLQIANDGHCITYDHGIIHGPFTRNWSEGFRKHSYTGFIDQGKLPVGSNGLTEQSFLELKSYEQIYDICVGLVTCEMLEGNRKHVTYTPLNAKHKINGVLKTIGNLPTVLAAKGPERGRGTLTINDTSYSLSRYFIVDETQPNAPHLDPSKAGSFEYSESEYNAITKQNNEIVDSTIGCMDVTKLIWSYIL